MLRNKCFYCYPSVVNLKSLFFLLKNMMRILFLVIPMLLAAGHASASHALALYDVDILVTDEATDTRWGTLKQGLDEVFVRISGDSIVMDKLKRPPSSRYVKQFSYHPVQDPTTNENGKKLTHRLKIQYNGSLMEKYLLDNGFPVWSQHRPDVVVWLAVRDGRNEYVLKDSDQSLLKTTVDEALIRRGVPERWPLYDYKDRKILSVADIRGGFKEPVANASQRYSRGPALAGSLIWNGKEWQSSWSLLMESGNRHWSLVDADYKLLINKAIDQAADAMGVVYAIHNAVNKRKLATIQLEIQSVTSIEKYRHIENYLTDLSAVEELKPLNVDGQNVVFEVTLRSNEKDFINLIKNDAELIEAEAIKPEAIKPEHDAQLVPDNNQLTDTQVTKTETENTVADTENNEAPLLLNQQNQIPLYHYKLTRQ